MAEPSLARPGRIDPWILGAGFLLHLQLGTPYAYSLLRPSLREEFQLGEVAATLPFSAILVCYTLGMLGGGWACDRFGPRWVGLLGSVLFGGGYALAGLAPTFGALLATYGVLCGFGIGLGYMAAVNTAVRRHPDRKGFATGVVVLGFGLSSALFALIVPPLIEAQGWRTTLMQMGSVFLVLSLALCMALDPAPAPETSPREADPPVAPGSAAKAPLALAWLAWAMALTVGLGWLAQLPELARNRSFDPSAVPLLVLVVALANGFARPVMGSLSDRFGRFRVLAIACALALATLSLPLFTSSAPLLWAVGLGVGISFGGWLVNIAPVASEFAGPRRAGTVYGLLFTAFGIGALCGPLAIGYLRTLRTDDALSLAGSLVLLLASGTIFLVLERSMRGKQ